MNLITRRKLISFILFFGGIGILFILKKIKILRKIFDRIDRLIHSPKRIPHDNQREFVKLPSEGSTISVEMALNSRCSSDYDDNPKKFHWGMFDYEKKLSEVQIQNIIHLVKIPRFTGYHLNIHSEKNKISFTAEKKSTNVTKEEWVMVESGMQQQALGLICSALGVGMFLKGISENGTRIQENVILTVRAHLDAMKQSYKDSYWTDLAPPVKYSLKRGSLPEPKRDGDNHLFTVLENLTLQRKGVKEVNEQIIGQLLWAARGRTPHYYRSMPWGMTIPTWGGKQKLSSVFLIWGKNLFRYINWRRSNPVHNLAKITTLDESCLEDLHQLFSPDCDYIILSRNETTDRALWEVGYQLFNLLIQGTVLDIYYQTFFLDERLKIPLKNINIKDPTVVFAIK